MQGGVTWWCEESVREGAIIIAIVFQSWLMLFDICDDLQKYWVKEGQWDYGMSQGMVEGKFQCI